MAKVLELKPDQTSVIDGKLRGVFREIASGKSVNAGQAKIEVLRMSNERSKLITSRNTPSAKK